MFKILFEDSGDEHQETKKTEPPILFCICCLKTNAPYFNLLSCSHADFLSSFTMPEIKPANQVVCYRCHDILKQIKLFKLQIEDTFQFLSEQVYDSNLRSRRLKNFKITKVIDINISHGNSKENYQLPGLKHENKTINTETNSENIINEKQFNFGTTSIEKLAKSNTRSPTTKRMPHDKKIKNIETALRIINSNNSNDCINSLATSIQGFVTNHLSTITHVLLSDNNVNRQIHDNIKSKSVSNDTEMLSLNKDISNDTIKCRSSNIIGENTVISKNTNESQSTYIPNDIINISNDTNQSNSNENIELQSTFLNDTIKSKMIDISNDVEMLIDKVKDTTQSRSVDTSNKDRFEMLVKVKSTEMVNESTIPSECGEATRDKYVQIKRLTREELMQERSVIAESKSYLGSPHRCESCLVGFHYSENLDDHVKRKHTPKPDYLTCDVCLQVLDSAKSYEEHTDRHYIRFQCTCGVRSSSYKEALVHKNICAQRGYSTDKKIKLKHRHRKNLIRICAYCNARFSSQIKFKRHMRQMHETLSWNVGRPDTLFEDAETRKRLSQI